MLRSPGVGVGLGDRADGADHAGVVEHHVEPTPRVDRRLDRGRNSVLVGDVAFDEARGVAEFGGDRLTEIGLDVGDDDRGALFDEAPGAGGTDPARCAGDDGDLAVQPIPHVSCRPSRSHGHRTAAGQSRIIRAIVSW